MRAREAFGFQLPLLELHCHWARTWEAGLNFWNVNIGPLPPHLATGLPSLLMRNLVKFHLMALMRKPGWAVLRKAKRGWVPEPLTSTLIFQPHVDDGLTFLPWRCFVLDRIFEILWIPSPWNTRTLHTSPWPRSPPPGRYLAPDLQTGRKEEVKGL